MNWNNTIIWLKIYYQLWIAVLFVSLSLFGGGAYLLKKALKHNRKDTEFFLRNIVIGFTGGLISAILIDLKDGINQFNCLTTITLIIFVVGIFAYIYVSFYCDNKVKK